MDSDNKTKPVRKKKSRFKGKRDNDRDLHDHMNKRYNCTSTEDEEHSMWMHRLKSGWFEDRARKTLTSMKSKMVEEYENADSLSYRDGMNKDQRKTKIRGHIESVDDEIEYYDRVLLNKYNGNSADLKTAQKHFSEGNRRKVMYGNFSNREDLVTIKKFDNELDLFREQILESLRYNEERENRYEDEIGLQVSEIVGEEVIPVESSGDLSTFMSVCGFLISEDKYWDYRDMDNYEYEIDDEYMESFYHAINLRDISIRNSFDYNIVVRDAQTIKDIRNDYLSDEELEKEIILINHLRNNTSIRVLDMDFKSNDIPEYSIIFMASGSGKSTLVKRYGDLFVDGDLLNPMRSNDYVGRMNDQYMLSHPGDWDALNSWHRKRIYEHRRELVGRILLIQHPDLVPPEILRIAKILFVFRTDRTGIRMNQLNVDSLLKYLSDMKKGLKKDFSYDNFKVVVSRYDNIIFEVIRYFMLRLRFRIKYKYKYRPHVRKPPLDW